MERGGEATSPHPLHRIGSIHVPDSSSVKTLFFRYCKDGTLKSLETCLRSGIVPVDVFDQDGLRGLDHACFLGHEEVAKLLIRYGASVQVASESGITALHSAALGSSVALVCWLVDQGAAINATNKDGQTPLHFASDGRTKVVSALLELKADTSITTKHLGFTALHKAVVGNHIEIVKMLLQAQANTEIQCTSGDTALHLACFHGYLDIAKLLVEQGANLHIVNKDGKTPHQVAQDERQLKVMAWLDNISSEGKIHFHCGKGENREVVVATEDFVSALPEHLSFSEGDFIEVLSKPFVDWWMGRVSHTGKTGLFCTLMVDNRPLVVLEGKYTTEMQLKHTDSSLKVILEVKKQIDEVSEILSPEERERLNDYKRAPLLTGKYQALRMVKPLAKHKRVLLAALKNVLSDLDCGLELYADYAESVAGDLVEASIKSHEKQRSGLKQRLQQLQIKGVLDAEKAEELAFTLDEKTQSLTNWNAMMMESKQARVFCVRLIHKLSEVFTGIKALHLFFQSASLPSSSSPSPSSSPLWSNPWVQSCAGLVLLGEPVPLPGFTAALGHHTEDNIQPKVVQMVDRIASLVPHVQIVDEVAMGTCIILAHVYFSQLTHLTPVGAAMLADGAVMHLLDYFQFDCPDNHGSFVTVEALGRAPVFARRSDLTARRLKMQTVPLLKPLSTEPWTVNGVFRLTGVKTLKGKKFRGPTTRSDLYGYRNGSKAEAHELCMAPVGEEDTIRPKGRKRLHKSSAMTEALYHKPPGGAKAQRAMDGEKSKTEPRSQSELLRLQRTSQHIDHLLSDQH